MNKGLAGATKVTLIFIVLTTMLFLIYSSVSLASSADSASLSINSGCDSHLTSTDCLADYNCSWCALCGYGSQASEVNQWLQPKCVNKGTSCGWQCVPGLCGAACSQNFQCSCPTSGCVGSDWYQYPLHGTCGDCLTSCYCNVGTASGEPCNPFVIKNDARCAGCNNDNDCNKLDKDYCDGTTVKHDEGKCVNHVCQATTSTVKNCDDGLFCNGQETCQNAACVSGTPIDCSSYNISTIATCDNNPDNYHFTWDFRSAFASQCNETTDQCTTGNGTITHACSVSSCGAKCDSTHSCDNKCVGNVRYYSGSCNSSCNCSYTTDNCTTYSGCYAYGNGCENRDYSCALGGCNYTFSNRNTDYYDNFTNYCSGDSIMANRTLHDFSCDGTCKDHAIFVNNSLVQNCNDLDGWYNTTNTQWNSTGQCTEKEQLQQEYRDYTCSAASCTYTVTDHKWIDTGNTRSKTDGTACDDGLFCTVNDVCTSGVCGGSPRDCSSYNISTIATCDNNPDNYHFTWDFRSAFASQCNETTDQCTTGNGTITHACSVSSCGAQCDSTHSCGGKCIGDVRYFSGDCDLASCNCSYSTENCSSKNGCYAYETGCEDRTYSCSPSNCTYTSSQHTDYNDSLVNYCSDDTIRAHKQLHDFSCDESCSDHTSWIDDQLVQDCSIQNGWYNTTNTQWISVKRCTEKEQLQQEYRNYTCSPDSTVNCSYTATVNQWIDTGNTRNKSVIEPLSPPNKTIGDPKSECAGGDWCDWKITTLTPITLTCENSSVKWRYALDGDWKDWNVNGSSVTIYFPEESNHTLEAYCIDDCGNSTADIENFKVDGTAFEIPLYKKWNLMSVPFVLFNDNPSEVFKNISDNVVSVWSYDNGNWYSWNPTSGGTLTSIKPGWGYWVLTNNDTKLLIAGSLFSPITTPPSKSLQNGWNLIGYYGTDWQTYTMEADNCGYDSYKYGDYAYCSLNSLIDTEKGLQRWSSLWGYDNCGNDTTSWNTLEPCNEMFAGKGYWIEMDVSDGYAPATNCIWNKEFTCSVPTV